MPKADRVFSTPPANTSLTRRSILGNAVAVIAAGALIADAAVNVTAIATSPAAAATAEVSLDSKKVSQELRLAVALREADEAADAPP